MRKMFLLLLFALIAGAVQAQPRIALVVGNSQYSAVPVLENPARDAEAMAKALEGLGFSVTKLIDSDRVTLTGGIVKFGRALRSAGPDATGLFYYAGHGVQAFGNNYLLPVDTELGDAADLGLVAVEVQTILRQMGSAGNRTNIMILDACRNNPFTNIPDLNDNGLAEMQAPTGTFLAYATAPGSVALDGANGNSPFTRALARLLPTPGLAIEQMFKQVRVEVLNETQGRQTPWDSSSLTVDFAFAETEKLSARDLEAQQFWESIKDTRDPVQIMLFLRGYSDTAFAGEARGLLSTVMEQELTGVAPKAERAKPEGPSSEEQALFAEAQTQATLEGYENYLKTYPKGTFAEIANQEIVALRQKSGHDPVGAGSGTLKVEPAPPPVQVAPKTPGIVTFLTPLESDEPSVNGKSIAELINSTPLYPPIEGLPESYWKHQTCSNCHQWTRERICTQAQTYMSAEFQKSLEKKHPLGGVLKRNLKIWAEGGCQ